MYYTGDVHKHTAHTLNILELGYCPGESAVIYLGDVPRRVLSSSLGAATRRTRPGEIIVRVVFQLCRLFALASSLLGGFGAAAATEQLLEAMVLFVVHYLIASNGASLMSLVVLLLIVVLRPLPVHRAHCEYLMMLQLRRYGKMCPVRRRYRARPTTFERSS